jgi:NIMA (never in mitosis gene a)-related kinase
LQYLHEQGVLHRDIKGANVLTSKDGTVKLGDMNVSKVANKKGLNFTQTGTPYYASPEIWLDKPYDIKSDVWSLGCVLYEMITLYPPFQADDMRGLYKKVIKGQYRKIPSTFSNDLAAMISALLSVNPVHRPDTKAIMSFPVF